MWFGVLHDDSGDSGAYQVNFIAGDLGVWLADAVHVGTTSGAYQVNFIAGDLGV